MALGYVRPAGGEEAEAIARIQLRTWHEAYADIVPAQVLRQMDHEWLSEQWRRACRQPPSPRHHVLIAVEQHESDAEHAEIVGFAAIGPAEDDGADAAAAAITDLLVEPRFGRRGHGSRLLSAAVDLWRADDLSTAYHWVFARDRVTRAFLTASGWDTDGATRGLDMDGIVVPQIRMHCDISPSDDAGGTLRSNAYIGYIGLSPAV